MKRAFMSELAIVRTLVPSIAGVGLFIFVVLTLANASDGDSGMSAGACAVSAMSPIMVMSSLPEHHCLLGCHGVRRRASVHRLYPALQQRGYPLDETDRL